MTHPDETTAETRIVALAETFHCLAGRNEVTDWNPQALDDWATGSASGGEKLAVQFVLGVYNQWDEWKCGRFDVIEAYGRWDEEHWAAFKSWAADPFTL